MRPTLTDAITRSG